MKASSATCLYGVSRGSSSRYRAKSRKSRTATEKTDEEDSQYPMILLNLLRYRFRSSRSRQNRSSFSIDTHFDLWCSLLSNSSSRAISAFLMAKAELIEPEVLYQRVGTTAFCLSTPSANVGLLLSNTLTKVAKLERDG